MPSTIRLKKISDRFRVELSDMLVREINDPRLSGVMVNDVRVDRELAFADIYVSAIEGKERAAEIIKGLEHASGYLRRELSARIDLRVFPRLRFHWDPTPERADHIEKILASLRNETNKPASESQDE